MWFFVDETWCPDSFLPKFGVLLGILVKDSQLISLSKLLYGTRKKYYGEANAKDAHCELKGKELLSNHILSLVEPRKSLPKNICIVKELLSYPITRNNFYLKIFASTVYSMTNKLPQLLSPNPRDLYEPFKRLIENVSMAAQEDEPKSKVTLVFDQRIGAQKDIAIAIHNYIGGMRLPNINIHPYFAVSNICPGVQFADIMALLLSKRIQRKSLVSQRVIMDLYNDMKNLCWVSKEATPKRYGLVSFNEIIGKEGIRYTIRK